MRDYVISFLDLFCFSPAAIVGYLQEIINREQFEAGQSFGAQFVPGQGPRSSSSTAPPQQPNFKRPTTGRCSTQTRLQEHGVGR
jgi:hypothetical protein